MQRLSEDAPRRATLDDVAGIEHHDLVAHMRREPQIMRDKEQRGPDVTLQTPHDLHDMGLRADIERPSSARPR